MSGGARFRRLLGSSYLYAAWVVALVATGGSLYFSEVMHYIPCNLCWFQRIFMYPLAIVLSIAAYRGDRRIVPYTLPLAVIGGFISLWHVLEQKLPGFADIAPCRIGVPCNVDYIDWLGFITIPILALTAFALIVLLFVFGPLAARGTVDADAEEAGELADEA
ncbi:disulfide oxidoreductase [Paenibacillus cymbidii]|uniref:disulfide oxidoreductase n=1 Tax=Paenibacillus cymbidii TaxID=1639034 RepID=UPI0010803EA3|nr:disulfide oxidoreductase [Paenibacillus cymbidii]